MALVACANVVGVAIAFVVSWLLLLLVLIYDSGRCVLAAAAALLVVVAVVRFLKVSEMTCRSSTYTPRLD